MSVLVPLHDFKPKLNRSISGFEKSIFLQRQMEVLGGGFLSFTGLLMCLPCVIPTCLSLCRCRPAIMGLKTPCCEFVIWVVFFFSPRGSNTLNAELSPTSISHYFPSHSRSRRNPHMRSHTMLCYYWQVFPIYLKMKQNKSFVEFHRPFNLAPSCANAHMWTLTRLQSASFIVTAEWQQPFHLFIFTDSIYLSQPLPYLRSALHYPPSARPHLISPLLSLLILFILPSSCHILFLLFCIRLSGGIPVTPWFVIHSSFPVMTTSPALSFSWGISHDLIED